MNRPWKIATCMVFATLLAGIFAIVSQPKTADAANPTTMSFQGKVVNSDGTNVANGTYSFVFKLYTVSSSGSAIWTETQSSVTVNSGVFHVNLGSTCPFFTSNACNGSTPIDFNTNSSLYLGITFNSDPAGEMSPRVQLQSVPFAFNSDRVGGLTVNQLVQLSPSGQQTGAINISGGVTSGGTVQGVTIVATGVLQGNSLNVNSGSFEVTSAGAVTGGTYNGATLSGTELTGDGALAITSGGSNQNLTVNASGSGQILVGGTSTGNILFGGGSGSTGCTLTNSTGAFACTSTINGATISGGSLSGAALTGTGAFSVTAGGSNQALSLNGSGSGAVNIAGTSTGSINLAGGYGSTGCTITTAGVLSCNGSGTFDSTLQATDITATGDIAINGGDITSTASAVNLFNTNTATNTLNIANATIATGQTGTVSIATNATGTGKTVVTIGSTIGASAVTLQSGSAGITLTGNTTVSGTLAVNGGTITSSASTVNLFNGASPSTINLATSANATDITIGNTTGTSSLTLQAGSGGISLTGNSSITGTLSATSTINSSTQLGAHNGSGGRVQLAAGGSGNTGFIQWYRSDNTTRIGYLGFNSGGANNLGMNLESGAAFQINGGSVGIGLSSTAPSATLQVNGTVAVGTSAALGIAGDLTVSRNSASTTGVVYFGSGGNYLYYNGTNFQMTSGLSIGSNLAVGSGASITNSLSVGQNLQVGSLAAAAGTHVCINGSNYLSSCSSSLAYKKDVTALTTADYEDVLGKIANTEIFTYRWKDGDNRINTGVISEYLPAELIQGLDSQNNPIPDWTSITGYLWAGTRQLAGQVNALHNANTQQAAAATIQSDQVGSLTSSTSSLLSAVDSLSSRISLIDDSILAANTQIHLLQSSQGDRPNWADITTDEILISLDPSGLAISPNGQHTMIGGDLGVLGDAAFGGAVHMDFKGSNSLKLSSDLGADVAGIDFTATPADTDHDTTGLFIRQVSGGGANGLDAGIRIDNANADTEIGAALQIENTGGGGYRNLIGSTNFSVSGAGDVAANGSVTGRNSLQLLDANNQQVFTIDAGGNANLAGALNTVSANVSGGLNVDGDANFAGLTTFQKLATFIGKTIFKQDVEFEGDITVAKDTAGYAKIRTGESSIHISFTRPYTTTPVVAANIVSGQFTKTSINNITVDGFDITLSEPAASETTLNWTAILVKDPRTATNSPAQ